MNNSNPVTNNPNQDGQVDQNNPVDQDNKKNKRNKRKKRKIFVPCKHDYAYMYYNSKAKESVYRCVNCGKWLYC